MKTNLDKELDKEIEDLLTALRLQPRKGWADEVDVPQVAGRCAGSYGCGGTPDHPERFAPADSTNPVDIFFGDLQELLRAGVTVEHGVVALARKHGKNEDLASSLAAVIRVLRDPDATREEFSTVLGAFASLGSSKSLPFDVVKALESGRLDAI